MTFPNITYADHKYSLLSWSRLPLPLFVLASARVIAPLVELGWGAGHVSSRRKSVADREATEKGQDWGGGGNTLPHTTGRWLVMASSFSWFLNGHLPISGLRRKLSCESGLETIPKELNSFRLWRFLLDTLYGPGGSRPSVPPNTLTFHKDGRPLG